MPLPWAVSGPFKFRQLSLITMAAVNGLSLEVKSDTAACKSSFDSVLERSSQL
jgi:hypothetical protein